MTLKVLNSKGQANTQIAHTLGVTEGAVRYHLRKEPMSNGNAKPFKAEVYADVIEHWMQSNRNGLRPPNVKDLYEHLVMEFAFDGSYKSVLRYVRSAYGKPPLRTYRRVETPPGAQTQIDWGEFRGVVVGGEDVDLHAFIMTLSHSRKPAIIWSRGTKQLDWHHCHNEAYRRLGGVAAVNRVDNVKTAVGRGAGVWGEVNAAYRAYAREVGFHVDACQPRAANAKGKVEAKVKLARSLVDPHKRPWIDLEELQRVTDEHVERWSQRAVCPATGHSVHEAWVAEQDALAQLPILPEPFDIVVNRRVRRDCTVSFENRFYTVPFRFAGKSVEVRGCPQTVQILYDSQVVQEYPRHTSQRLLIDQSCYDGEPGTPVEGVLPPLPLGDMGKKMQEIMDAPVQKRPIDLYAALAEGVR